MVVAPVGWFIMSPSNLHVVPALSGGKQVFA